MHKYLKKLESFVYFLRNSVWSYPDFFFEENRYRGYLRNLYKIAIPYSHVITITALIFLVLATSFRLNLLVRGSEGNTLKEAVVTGINQDGNVQKIDSLNPLNLSNIQLERDIIELVYEPLIRYRYELSDNGDSARTVVENVLAADTIKIKQGADYQFNLKRGVKWHDGTEFTADDVVASFDKFANLESSNTYIQAIKQLQWEKIDKYSVRVCTRPVNPVARAESSSSGESEDIPEEVGNFTICDDRLDKPVLANFLELLSIKILPAHLIGDINSNNFTSNRPTLYRDPIGTGLYKLNSVGEQSISLELNEEHYSIALSETTIDIDNVIRFIEFIYFKDLSTAVKAVENGEVHSLATSSSLYDEQIEEFKKLNALSSPPIYTQFWGVYLNQRVNPNNGIAIGPDFFQDVNVRRAINLAIDKEEIVSEGLNNSGEVAQGPIARVFEFNNTSVDWGSHDLEEADRLLNESGWDSFGSDGIRVNQNNERLSFELAFVENSDRKSVAEIIKENLEEVGIEVIIDRSNQRGQKSNSEGWTLKELNEQLLAPRLYDAILYGANTFIDPDRYELYHSSQTNHPGLNISGYVGTRETVRTREDRQEGESSLVTVPKVDRLLEQARSFDPERNKEERLESYNEFQELLAEDSPVIFLYHPQYKYYVSSKVQNIDLSDLIQLEDRFRNILSWKISN